MIKQSLLCIFINGVMKASLISFVIALNAFLHPKQPDADWENLNAADKVNPLWA